MPQLKELRGDLVFPIDIPGNATAGTADEWPAMVATFNMKITGVKWVPSAAITAHATNYFTLTLRNRTTGAGAALPAQRSYAATNGVAFAAETCTLSSTAADLLVAAGDTLSVEKLVAASGLAMPKGTVQIHAQAR